MEQVWGGEGWSDGQAKAQASGNCPGPKCEPPKPNSGGANGASGTR